MLARTSKLRNWASTSKLWNWSKGATYCGRDAWNGVDSGICQARMRSGMWWHAVITAPRIESVDVMPGWMQNGTHFKGCCLPTSKSDTN